jgi:hypothetical protein
MILTNPKSKEESQETRRLEAEKGANRTDST